MRSVRPPAHGYSERARRSSGNAQWRHFGIREHAMGAILNGIAPQSLTRR
ncbi:MULTISPECIES: hypothetical protein [Streptomyces]|nr:MULTISPECIES: hypothetical protein [Streptomyces]